MANEGMRVVALMARKGGSGKSVLVKALASAALAGGHSALLIDMDPQNDLTLWYEDLRAREAIPPGARMEAVASTADLEVKIQEAYERGDADFIFIDTAGSGGTWSDAIAMLADHLVTPVICTKSDLRIGSQTHDWFKGLHERVKQPEALPSHQVVVTRFPASARTSKVHMRLLQEAMNRFPLVQTIIQERSAYLEMDEQGFLGDLAQRYRGSADALQRGQARRFEDAIVESTLVLNEILGR